MTGDIGDGVYEMHKKALAQSRQQRLEKPLEKCQACQTAATHKDDVFGFDWCATHFPGGSQ